MGNLPAHVLALAHNGARYERSDIGSNNDDFRREIHTTKRSQVVMMTLAPQQVLEGEIHENSDQHFIVISGVGRAKMKYTTPQGEAKLSDLTIQAGSILMVDAGMWHEISAGQQGLKLVTIYAAPQHKPGTVQHTAPKGE